jgi:guanylate kinase
VLFVVSSPSGGGKGTLIRRALKEVAGLAYSVSFTTRAPRPGEADGRDYHFVSPEKFMGMVGAGDFLEWAEVHGNLYGTSREQAARELAEGRDIILEIDVQGAANVRRLGLRAVYVFILPPSFDVLRERLRKRGSEGHRDVELRLRNAAGEVAHYKEFDYVIINDVLETAAGQLIAIVKAERSRRERREEEVGRVIATFPRAPAAD